MSKQSENPIEKDRRDMKGVSAFSGYDETMLDEPDWLESSEDN